MKKTIPLLLTFAIVFSLFAIPVSAEETGIGKIISAFENQKSYAGAYVAPPGVHASQQVLHIATTDVAAFERRKVFLAQNHGFNGKVFDETVFVEARYTLAFLQEVTQKIWEDDDYRVEFSGTDQSRNIAEIGIVNPPEGAEAALRKKYNCDNIEVTVILREFVQPGDGWVKAVQKTQSSVREDKYTGWASNSAGQRAYFKDGVRQTGVHRIDGFNCVFDQNGIFLGRRRAGADFNTDFGEDNSVSIEDGKISFDINFKNVDRENIGAGTYFKLFVYMSGAWKEIPHDFSLYNAEGNGISDEGVMRFSMPTSSFSGELTPGLYRVRAEIIIGRGSPNLPRRTVTGEFNLIP
ncbi:MAG: hypothetical protein FWH08_01370 [Oscillospiraceae bacterium]|nr:hypothetical protein [Oscillospiraceae bacterium]